MNSFKSLLLIMLGSWIWAHPIFGPIPTVTIDHPEKYRLGKRLFFDPHLSSDGKVACASCHKKACGGADCLPKSIGVFGRKGLRNATTIFNTRFNIAKDRIGLCQTIKERTILALQNPLEMDNTIEKILTYLRHTPSLAAHFTKVYSTISAESLLDAIGYYVAHLTTPHSRFDRFLAGDTKALNTKEKAGYRHFIAYGCTSCHNGVNLGGNSYQPLGIFEQASIPLQKDPGRYLVTNDPNDRHVFRVAPLRNVARTAPYFHDGSIKTLRKAIKIMVRYQLGIDIPEKEIQQIEAFLHTLNGVIHE